MVDRDALDALSALAHATRLAVYRYLVQAGPDGAPAGVVAEALGAPASTLSFHLSHLTRAGLIAQRREGRQLIYAADYARMDGLIGYLTENCCRGDVSACAAPAVRNQIRQGTKRMPGETWNVLFLCTGNSARSILAESLLNHWGQGRFRGFSAGSFPKGQPHPTALDLLRSLGLPTEGLRSKSWDEFAGPDAPRMDFIFTVCDQAAGEVCPVWPGQPVSAHWGLPDPAGVEGAEALRRQAFRDAFRQLESWIKAFVSLRPEALDRVALTRRLDEIRRDVAPEPERSAS